MDNAYGYERECGEAAIFDRGAESGRNAGWREMRRDIVGFVWSLDMSPVEGRDELVIREYIANAIDGEQFDEHLREGQL